MKQSIIKKNLSGWLLIIPTLLLFVVLVWRPIIIGICYSFFRLEGFTPVEFVGIKNHIDVITDTNFITVLGNTVQYVLWSLVIGLPLPFVAAVVINEMVFMKGYFKVTSYLPVVIPAIASCMLWQLVYSENANGLLNMVCSGFGMEPVNWLGNKNIVIMLIIIAMTWNSFGSAMIVYLASLQGINNELYEAARLDGAGIFMRLRHVLWPRMKGITLLMAVRQIISVFNVTEQPLTMTGGGPNNASMSLGLVNYYYAFKYGQYDKSLALGVIVFCLLISLTIVYSRLQKNADE